MTLTAYFKANICTSETLLVLADDKSGVKQEVCKNTRRSSEQMSRHQIREFVSHIKNQDSEKYIRLSRTEAASRNSLICRV